MEILCGGQVNKETATAVTIGNFDGVHIGHQKLFSDLGMHAAKQNLKTVVYTFSSHPLQVQKKTISLILDEEEKVKQIEKQGIDILYLDDFLKVSDLSPEAFVKEVLLDKLHMKVAVVGENNRFGKQAQGDANTLKELGKRYGFEVYVTPSVAVDNVIYSSSEIRNRIETGDMPGAAKMLGRPFSVKGEVVQGKQLGRTYGFPTANLVPKEGQLLPKFGVYATRAEVENKSYLAITNVGETSFDKEKQVRMETHILDFHENLYGKSIQLEFISYMRDIRAFCSTDELEEQLQKDRTTRKEMEEMI